jgi:hypothetical protein
MDQLATLTGLRTAIKDGEVTLDEAFPNTVPIRMGKVAGLEEALTKKDEPEKPPVDATELAEDSLWKDGDK